MARWTALNFLVLPEDANDLGIGASRHYIMLFADAICHPSFKYAFVMDDNVVAWKAPAIGASDSFFDDHLPYPIEVFQSGREGKMKDVPLSVVLEHFQHDDFRSELKKFGIIGFDRLSSRHYTAVPVKSAFARRHVGKAVILNLGLLRSEAGELVNYKKGIHVMEDLDFNLRCSGRERTPGGSSQAAPANEMEIFIDKDRVLHEQVEKILDGDDDEGPAIVCKCYRFVYRQNQKLGGGCSEELVRPAPEPEPKPEPPAPAPSPKPAPGLTEQLAQLELEVWGNAYVPPQGIDPRLEALERYLEVTPTPDQSGFARIAALRRRT